MSAPDRGRRVLNVADPHTLFLPVFAAGSRVPLEVTGHSMEPFLHEGRDTVWLIAPTRPLRRGDIVFFLRPPTGWVLHRVVRLTPQGCVVGGDAQNWVESVESARILAVTEAVERNGKTIVCGSFCWRAYAVTAKGRRAVRRVLTAIHRLRVRITKK